MKNRWILVIKLYFDKYSIVWTCSNFWKMWSSLDCRDWVLSSQLPCLLTKVLSSWGVEITGQQKYVRYSPPPVFFFFPLFFALLENQAVLRRLFCQLELLHYSGLWGELLCFGFVASCVLWWIRCFQFIPLIEKWYLRFSETLLYFTGSSVYGLSHYFIQCLLLAQRAHPQNSVPVT